MNAHYVKTVFFFSKSNLTIEEVYQLVESRFDSVSIQFQLGLSSQTTVDWDMFCREVCETIIVDECQPIGGFGKSLNQ